MRKFFSLKKILISLLIVFALIQFIRIDETNPSSDPTLDFITITQPDDNIKGILKTSCYDCHSNESKYPWYAKIAPASWFLKDHIIEGRKELNLSLWGNFSGKRKAKKLEECVELVNEGEMPLWSYTLIHTNAQLSEAQRTQLVNWFQSLRSGKIETH
jgi:hypothetical protein